MDFNSLSPEEQAEAIAFKERAELAERKALERAKQRELEQSNHIPNVQVNNSSSSSSNNAIAVKFLSKQEREALALKRLEDKRIEDEKRKQEAQRAHQNFVTGKTIQDKEREMYQLKKKQEEEKLRRVNDEKKETKEYDNEVEAIRRHYLGGENKKRRVVKQAEKFIKLFQFDWEAEDDTTRSDFNPLYNNRMKINALFGRGYIAGIDQREQRKESNFITKLSEKRMNELKRLEEIDENLTEQQRVERQKQRDLAALELKKHEEKRMKELDNIMKTKQLSGLHWSDPDKKLSDMTERDWRIFREDFDIHIQGGRAVLPLRYWTEANFPVNVMKAIEAMKYEKPSPIQRQAIPVALSGRDIIGIAETGSGKTAAFLLPMICYLQKLPTHYLNRCDKEGPLAVVMAPTRELAQQIDEESQKLCKYTQFTSVCVVGGQDIEDQGYRLRRGVQIVIGTPGRMVDCLEHNYMVLNQCNYVVLDEADRMVDMGFEPQVIAVLDNMGTLLKSEEEEKLEQQVSQYQTVKTDHMTDDSSPPEIQLYRTTAMFSATMPAEVERIAKNYLRHPVIIRIGDEDSGKNKRIDQRVIMLTSESQKKVKLSEELSKLANKDKVIVFINSKKQCDIIGKYIDTNLGFSCGILHGGRSQDQREETLEYFRSGEYQILVASDVAARGLDIPDVTLVVNYDCPGNIQNYTHRIGRTGRAGKFGVAVTYVTESDAEIMYDLKSYLEATNMPVPSALASNPAAQHPVGSRDEKGKVMGQKKDSIQYSKK